MTTAYDDLAFVAPRGAPAYPWRNQSSAELYCKDCDEIATQTTPDRKRCLICGCELEDRAAASRQRSAESIPADPANASERDIERLMQLLVESLGGEGLGGVNDARRPAAQSAVANLGSFTADQASTIEVAVAVSGISGEVVAVPANFGPCESLPRAQICVADPLDGSQPFRNAEALKGKIVVMERGTCTFAQKVVRAQAAGAVGVIVIQTFDVWPYTMTDSKGESASLTIPAFMLSMKQGKRFLEYLREHGGETAPSAEITVRKNERECVICQVEMTIGAKLTRMPCQHMFHTDCLHQWLKIGNSCPICRVEIPSKNGSSSSAPTPAQEQQRAAAWGAWFS